MRVAYLFRGSFLTSLASLPSPSAFFHKIFLFSYPLSSLFYHVIPPAFALEAPSLDYGYLEFPKDT